MGLWGHFSLSLFINVIFGISLSISTVMLYVIFCSGYDMKYHNQICDGWQMKLYCFDELFHLYTLLVLTD